MLIASITAIVGVITVAILIIGFFVVGLDESLGEELMLPVIIGLLLFWILFIISAIYEEKL